MAGGGSSQYKPRTKAAMKGYENFKVSIPTTGIDLQQALHRSPNPSGCKLAALADIALGNDVPHAVGLIPSASVEPSKTIDHQAATVIVTTNKPLDNDEDDDHDDNNDENRSTITTKKPTQKSTMRKKKSPVAPAAMIGNKLGFNQRKKKIANVKEMAPTESSAVPKDVYDFDDSRDSLVVEPLLGRTPKTDSPIGGGVVVATTSTIPPPPPLPIEPAAEDSQMSSFSDRDDYNYEDNSLTSEDGGGNVDDDDDDDDSDSDSASSSSVDAAVATTSRPSSTTKKRSSTAKSINNVQKKCLIMGRIFKSVKKPDATPKDTIVVAEQKGITAAIVPANKEKKKIPKQELDKMFDSLRGDADVLPPSSKGSAPPIVDKKPAAQPQATKADNVVGGGDDEKPTGSTESTGERRRSCSRKPREIANLEAEWGMSMDAIIGLMGVGPRKPQRRCAANKQKTFAETWSSDEYEDFHSTKDIIALIQEVEKKATKSAARSAAASRRSAGADVDESALRPSTAAAARTNDGSKRIVATTVQHTAAKDKENVVADAAAVDCKMGKTSTAAATSEVTPPAIVVPSDATSTTTTTTPRKLRFASASDSDSDETSAQKKPATVATTPSPPTAAKIKKRRRTIAFKETSSSGEQQKQQTTTTATKSTKKKESSKVAATTATAGVSSSTGGGGGGKEQRRRPPKPMARRKRIASEMLYYWSSSSDEEFGRIKPRDNFDDDHLEQHGWIVGDSHKKLVTLLAHAKGKKIEDCGVKEAIHKKKSSS